MWGPYCKAGISTSKNMTHITPTLKVQEFDNRSFWNR
jgi:hypothetical protein